MPLLFSDNQGISGTGSPIVYFLAVICVLPIKRSAAPANGEEIKVLLMLPLSTRKRFDVLKKRNERAADAAAV